MNTQEYLDNVMQVIQECFRPADSSGSMPVATVAYLVKRRLGVDHTSFGFAKFKDVLNNLEGRGSIRTGSNTKHAFALWLLGSTTEALPPTGAAAPTTAPYRPLRNSVWFAFISQSPPGRRFLNCVSGEVRLGLQETLGTDWVEIVPVDASKEKDEATRFLCAHELDRSPELQQSLSSEKWYVALPAALAKVDPQLAFEWKRQRSNRVMSLVDAWRSENRVNDQLIFDQPSSRLLNRVGLRRSSDLRQCLLSAIRRMSTDRLLDLNITARLLIAEIRPDLLDN